MATRPLCCTSDGAANPTTESSSPPQPVLSLGSVLRVFTRQSVPLASGRIPAHLPKHLYKKARSNPGKETPVPPAEVLLRLLATALGSQIAWQKNGTEHQFLQRVKGRGTSPPLYSEFSNCLPQLTELPRSLPPGDPPQGMTTFCLLEKVESLTQPVLLS